jgi:hypothetical protein
MRFLLGLLLLATGCDDAAMRAGGCNLTAPGGTEPGDALLDLTVQTCVGEPVSLRRLACGAPLTLIDVGSAAYPGCIETTRTLVSDPAYVALRADGLQVVQIFTSDSEFQRPSKQFCEAYVQRHGIDFTFLIDPLAETDAFSARYPLNLVVNQDGVLVEKWSPEVPADRADRLRTLLDD